MLNGIFKRGLFLRSEVLLKKIRESFNKILSFSWCLGCLLFQKRHNYGWLKFNLSRYSNKNMF